MKTGASRVQPLFHQPYFSFFKNENGQTFWTKLWIKKRNQISQEEVRHKKAIHSILARPHEKVLFVFNGINYTLLIPEKDIKGVPRKDRGRFFQK